MRKLWALATAMALLLVALTVIPAYGDGPNLAERPGQPIPDSYIVTLQPGAATSEVVAAHGVTRQFTYQAAFHGFAGIVPPGRLAALQADPRVTGVYPNRVVSASAKPDPNKPGSGSQVTPENVKRVGAAPGNVPFTGQGVSIAIIDTGVDRSHRDLSVVAACFDAFGGNCSDGNGHGTHVAGIAAARNNDVDVVGVAPDATIVAVRVLDSSGSGSDATVLAGIDWVTANAAGLGIRVANASLGRPGTVDDNPALQAAVQSLVNAGVTFIVAAGNDPNTQVSQQIPAAYPEAVAVASSTAVSGSNQCRSFSGVIAADTASYFTTDGAKTLVSAPGEERENISRGCFIQSQGVLSLKAGGGTTRMAGTSMAAPAVSGVAALLAQQNPASSVADITARLSNADREGIAPLNSPASSYTFDGVREGIVYAPHALGIN